MSSDQVAVAAAYDALDAALDAVLAASVDALSTAEKLVLQDRLEYNVRRLPTVQHQLINALTAEADPKALGGKNWAQVLSYRLRISEAEAKRRVTQAGLLGPRTAITGEPLAPAWPAVAAAQARGQIGAEHVAVIEKFFTKLPARIDAQTRGLAEADLARIGTGLGPTELREAAKRLAALLDQDGELPDDAERARRRYLRIHSQNAQGMSRIEGLLDPQATATLEAVLATLGAPGMCNPADDNPCVDGEPDCDAVQRDTRSVGQRNHDALTAMGRAVLASGQLGQHNGLPATIIVTAALQDLQAAAGVGVTAGGSLVPMRDVITLASQAHHYLVIYDKHTRQALYCGRAKRFATPGQRVVLHAMERGCTRPGCTAPGYWCQVHHVEGWVAAAGETNINTLTLACGPDNRAVEEQGWTTRKRADGRTEWIPPPHLDTGQTRINDYHHPENYLKPEDDP
ncbi:HNH endonuclease signature motif containing protein [Mycobacterium sp. NPDC048908]|uniref:HNH endonuclease signature motif containing protein n=1 Tax=Mycobacterium sp. NPDC048908 TaxID=3364292 RepID=UPI003710EF29